jgi:hypothetical protein
VDFQVNCACGKPHTVQAGNAGSVLPCPCGRQVTVPNLSELRRRHGLTPYDANPVLVIERLLAAGELPEESACIRCGVASETVTRIIVECEKKWVRRYDEFRWYYLFMPWIVLVAWYIHQRPEVREFGKDVVLTLPLRLCEHCRAEARRPAVVKTFLRLVPVYGRLLDRYPDAKVTLLP